jgi:phage portal protein BeeE
VLPLVTRTAKALSGWLSPGFGEAADGTGALELRPDLDAIEALSTEREAPWERVRRSDFLTVNEKRAAVGYEPVEGGDRLAEAVGGE